MSGWRTDLERLKECYQSTDRLSEVLGYERNRVRQVLDGASDPGEELKRSITEHMEILAKQNTIAFDIAIRCIQTLEWVIERDPEPEEIKERKEKIQEMTEQLLD